MECPLSAKTRHRKRVRERMLTLELDLSTARQCAAMNNRRHRQLAERMLERFLGDSLLSWFARRTFEARKQDLAGRHNERPA